MDKILNELPDEHISNETLWIYKENVDIFNKYNQMVSHTKIQPKEESKQELKQESKQESKQELKQEPKPIKYEDNHQQQLKEQPIIKDVVKTTNKNNKQESPIDLILRLTSVDKIMKVDIKNKLIEFISLPECSKVFGMKKSSEIMTALTKDSWNQSISLFISFLLNKNVIYKEKSYVYYKDKENETITI
jgi:hypothetical protein